MERFQQEQQIGNNSLQTPKFLQSKNKIIQKFRFFVGLIPIFIPVLLVGMYLLFFSFIFKYVKELFSISFVIFIFLWSHYKLYCLLYHWFKSYTTKPFIIPINYYHSLVNNSNLIEFCDICNQQKYPRTHHCSVCNQCVVRYDHHCAWLSCIGLHNIRHFYLFLYHGTTTTLLGLYMLIVILYNKKGNQEFYFKSVLLITLVLANLFITCLLQFIIQTVMISVNETMVDMISTINSLIKNKTLILPYYISLIENWRDAFLVRKDLSLLWYFLPYTPSIKYNITVDDLDSIEIDV
ncbi:zinc finger protein DHHC domain containing protein, putative [Entamoeba dispar SAW760]|uniref:Palmitoyltransferase n=1 Tax=Entamoeba dispar (strain ATCC PRA-260 / SAW760) TaxID=370354 RepID=B0EM95_ENTDS|nr:zinc finger protein DHHC domain containing protein, putative [Entamoeba dispar SAW760]EDR24313.1 zinc finger protein DHHC domain containing protein, putative [Entamoeba dispar SAW760]|eukprot:EDR24313.1 zinc finger protein DHHC domain containing protein, putative [Entamoeba dispar SAW760]